MSEHTSAGQQKRGKLSPNVEGALWMLGAAFFFTLMTTLIKHLGHDYPPALQSFYRQAAAFLVLLPVLIRQPRVFIATRPGILIFRSGIGTAGQILANYTFQVLPLAVANALSFTRALWMAPIALLVLGERVDLPRIGFSLLGFAGVLIILGFGVDLRQPTELWPTIAGLGAAALFAFTVAGGKVVTRDHGVLTIMAWSATLGVLFTIPPALFVWRWPSLEDLGLLILMGAAATGTQGCFTKGLQKGDATAVAPVDYVRLVLALIVDLLVFNHAPPWTSLLGAAVIIAAALLLAWREHTLSLRAPKITDKDKAADAELLSIE